MDTSRPDPTPGRISVSTKPGEVHRTPATVLRLPYSGYRAQGIVAWHDAARGTASGARPPADGFRGTVSGVRLPAYGFRCTGFPSQDATLVRFRPSNPGCSGWGCIRMRRPLS